MSILSTTIDFLRLGNVNAIFISTEVTSISATDYFNSLCNHLMCRLEETSSSLARFSGKTCCRPQVWLWRAAGVFFHCVWPFSQFHIWVVLIQWFSCITKFIYYFIFPEFLQIHNVINYLVYQMVKHAFNIT